MVLGKLPVPGRPTILITVGHGPIALSASLWETARYRLKYCLKGPLNPKQPTNQLSPLRCDKVAFILRGHADSRSDAIKYVYIGWLVGCFGFNGPLRQYFSLYRAVS